jgi:hypothetical protein
MSDVFTKDKRLQVMLSRRILARKKAGNDNGG